MSLLTEMQADSPSGLWMLDTTTDSSGNGKTLVLVNSPAAAASIIPTVSTDARDFNGTTQSANTTGIDLADLFTLEAWFVIDTLPGSGASRCLIYRHNCYQLTVFNRSTAPTGARVWLSRPNTGLLAASTTDVVADGTLYHAVITKNGADVHVYVNGADVTNSIASSTCVNVVGDNHIASNSSGAEFFDGRIQAAAVYPTAISSARVTAHYEAGIDAGAAPTYFQTYGIA